MKHLITLFLAFVVSFSVYGQDDICLLNSNGMTRNFDNHCTSDNDFTLNAGTYTTNNAYLFNLQNKETELTINANVTINNSATLAVDKDAILIVPSGYTLMINGDFTFTSAGGGVNTRGLQVDGELIIDGNLDLGNLTIEIDGSGSIEAQSLSGTDGSSCSGDGNCPSITTSTECTTGSGICTEPGTVTLPIELLSFNAIKSNNEVTIYWATASEINNDYFEIERSVDGINFEVIAKIAGAGNSYFKREYQHTVLDLGANTTYYRLKQVDHDGTTTLFQVRQAVETSNFSTTNQFIIAPNPTSADEVTVFWDELDDAHLRFVIVNTSGHLIYDQTKAISPMRHLPLDLSGANAGVYYLMIYGDNGLLGKERLVIR